METRPIELIDQYGRHLNYLRMSVTDRCNLRCLYCMPSQGVSKLKHDEILTYEELHRLARLAVRLGVEKIRLTGGEPLLRKGIYDFMPLLTAIPGLLDVSLTTNGIFLRDNVNKIKAAGIKRINVSLDSLQPERYEKITGFDGFHQVWEGIESAKDLGFNPIKINVVVIQGLNDDEIIEFGKLSLDYPFHIRFIEYMPIGVQGANPLHHVTNGELKNQLLRLGKLLPIPKSPLDGPADRHKIEGAKGEIGFISALSDHFCPKCNRLRLTPNGHIRPCLLSNLEQNLKGPMRSGASDEELARIFVDAALKKPYEHHIKAERSIPLCGQMSSIGG